MNPNFNMMKHNARYFNTKMQAWVWKRLQKEFNVQKAKLCYPYECVFN